MFSEPIVRYEVVVKYNNGERARFLKDDMSQALDAAQSLQRLPSTVNIWINTVTIEQSYEWSRS